MKTNTVIVATTIMFSFEVCSSLKQKSVCFDLNKFLPYIREGDLQIISFGSNIWWDKDWSQPIIQLLSQEHFHGLAPINNFAEMCAVFGSFGNNWSMFPRIFTISKRDNFFKTFELISFRLQLLTSKTEVLTKYGRYSRRRRSLLSEKSSLYLT